MAMVTTGAAKPERTTGAEADSSAVARKAAKASVSRMTSGVRLRKSVSRPTTG